MKFHGVQIQEGSSISNLTVASGTAFPGSPNEAEMFYRTDSDIRVRGLYAYIGGSWDRIASSDAITVPSAAAFPSVANIGDLFYKDSNDANEALYVYTGSAWVPAASGSGSTVTVTGDVTGTLTVSDTGALTLATIIAGATVGTASNSTVITYDSKGRITGSSTTPIAIAATQVTSGSFSDARIAQSNVTQHQSALSLAASQTTSGTFADARIASSNVVQHQAALTILETQITDGTLLARNAGNETITGAWQFNNALPVGTPSSSSHATTKAYVDSAINGLSWKNAVTVATTANITLSGTQIIDGVAVVAGNRVLVKNQSTQAQNGVYVVAAGAWTRAADFDQVTPVDEVNSAAVFVQQGTLQADTAWTQTAPVASIGSDAMTFTQFATGGLIGGAGLTLTGNQLDVVGTAGRIVANADNIDLATVTNSGTGTFQKLTIDGYGRVSGTTAVVAADITTLTDASYVLKSGDAMTGNLGIGRTPVTSLDVQSSTQAIIRVRGGSATNQGAAFYVAQPASETSMSAFGDSASIIGGTPGATSMLWSNTQPLSFHVNGGERMRIDSSGNVGIGNSAPAWNSVYRAMTIGPTNGYGAVVGSSNASGFGTSYGQLGIWQNSYYTNASISIAIGAGAGSSYIQGGGTHLWYSMPSVAAGATQTLNLDMRLSGTALTLGRTGGGATGTMSFVSPDGGRPGMSFTNPTHTWNTVLKGDAGQNYYMINNNSETVGVYMTTLASGWNNLSDERFKENITPIEDAVAKVDALRAVRFTWKEDPSLPADVGLIAQDVLEVLPEAVDTTNPAKLGVRYTHVVPLLVAAIKELSATNAVLLARIEALEAK